MRKFLLPILLLTSLFAKETTFVREYTYQASDYDSKVTSRANALEQVKKLLLEEVSVFIISEVDWTQEEIIIDGKYTMKDVYEQNIKSITAGVTETIIIDEKWTGETYWLKAEITLDPDNIKVKIEKIVENKQKLKELEEVRKIADDAVVEIERLRKELAESKSVSEQLRLTKAYIEETEILSASDWFQKGYKAGSDGDLVLAVQYYEKSLELDPNFHDGLSYYNLGTVYLDLENYTKAIKNFENALVLFPNCTICIDNLAFSYQEQGNLPKALQLLSKAIELNPNDSEAYFNLAFFYDKQLNYTKAIEFYEKTIELDHDSEVSAGAYVNLGLVYSMQGNEQKKISNFKKAARLGNKKIQDWLKENGHAW